MTAHRATTLHATTLHATGPGSGPDTATRAGWTLAVDGDGNDLVRPALLALANGTTGVVEGLTLAAGAFGTGPDGLVRPLPGPVWTEVAREAPDRRLSPTRSRLDLRAGTVTRSTEIQHVTWFVSLARPGAAVLRIEGQPGSGRVLAPPGRYALPAAEHSWSLEERDDGSLATTTSDRAAIVAAARQRKSATRADNRIDRVVAVRAGSATERASLAQEAAAKLDELDRLGVDRLLDEHQSAWERRWDAADIEIDGDPDAQLAIRLALFHLLTCAATRGESVVGARALTGLAYAGHVFWDTDVFVLPALAATLPAASRSIVEYRIRRLQAARAEATERGLPGARFPWESADDGRDVTPRSARDLEGGVVPVVTGLHAEHITSDVVWALLHHVEWTGDAALLQGPARALVTETARYWAARAHIDADGTAHVHGVIGPDEYHELVDDNAYTNVLVRWHLRQAASLEEAADDRAAAKRHRELADRVVDGFDATTGRYEQFAGYDGLEPILVSELAEPPVAADMLLGREAVARSQIIKQPDVMMLHHVLPGECPPGSLVADIDHYLPRTAHGSSLSPAICASLLARAGRPDEAMRWFDLAARLDLDDLTGTTAGGLHLATMGGLWQAVVHGFCGIRPDGDRLSIDPRLPARWRSLRVRLQFRERAVVVTLDHEGITISSRGAEGWPDDLEVDVAGQRVCVHHGAPVRVGIDGDVRPSAAGGER